MSNLKPKHTPGPWLAQTHHKVNTKNGKCNVIHKDGPMFCIIDGVPFREAQANARLIAAAPDLLETVERMTKLLESIERETGYCTTVTQRDARALIAKVTGGAE
jgi:hypothetical protein